MPPKTHRIESTSSGLLSLPVLLLVLLIASIVMLGVLGDAGATPAHAQEPVPATAEAPELSLDAG